MFSEFFTLDMLITFTGSVLAVGVITEMFKKIGVFLTLPTQLVSYVAALIVLVGGNLALGTFTWSGLFLIILNAAVVSLVSNGGYDLVNKVASVGERREAEAQIEEMLELEAEAHDPNIDNQ